MMKAPLESLDVVKHAESIPKAPVESLEQRLLLSGRTQHEQSPNQDQYA